MRSTAAANRFVESEKIHLVPFERNASERAASERASEPLVMNTGGADCSRRHKSVALSPVSNECDRAPGIIIKYGIVRRFPRDRRVFALALARTDRRERVREQIIWDGDVRNIVLTQ